VTFIPDQKRYSSRVGELSRLPRWELEGIEAAVRKGQRIYSKPSKDELITEILFAEGLIVRCEGCDGSGWFREPDADTYPCSVCNRGCL